MNADSISYAVDCQGVVTNCNYRSTTETDAIWSINNTQSKIWHYVKYKYSNLKVHHTRI